MRGPTRTERLRASRRNRPQQKPAPTIIRLRKAIREGLSQPLQGCVARRCPASPSITQGSRKPRDALVSDSDRLDPIRKRLHELLQKLVGPLSDVRGFVRSSLCSRWRFCVPREVRLALFQKGRKRFFCVLRAHLHAKLFVLSLHRHLDLLTEWQLHEPFAGLQRRRRLRRQFTSCFGGFRQDVLVGRDFGNQSQIRSAPRIKGSSQQKTF
jgi:hypothetical protein